MTTPVLIWIAVAVATTAVLLTAFIANRRHPHHTSRHPAASPARRHLPLFEIGEEWEEFYLPGDKILKYNYDDPDD